MASYNKLTSAKQAAKNFIDVLAADSNNNNRIGLVSFSNTASLNSKLTNNFSSVKSQIDSLSSSNYTCQQCGIKTANQEISADGRAGVKKVIVMLTDGQANWIEGATKQVDTPTAEAKAMVEVNNGFSTNKTSFYTIGLGDPNGTGDAIFYGPDFLKQIALVTGGKYYFPAPSELNAVYQEISMLIGKGLVGGFVFNDLNGNGKYLSLIHI